MAYAYRSALLLLVCTVANCSGDNSTAAAVVDEDDSALDANLTGRSWNYACSPPCAFGSRCDDLQRKCVPHVDCSTSPCLQDGICIFSGLGYTCNCVAPACGSHCENICPKPQTADTCSVISCPPGHRCRLLTPHGNPYGAECVPTVPCDGRCLNGGTCLQSNSRYQCICEPLYWGRRCQFGPSGPCATKPCMNHGDCRVTANGLSFTCACRSGSWGRRCQFSSAPSIPNPRPAEGPCLRLNPCRNSCQCVPSCRHASGYYCRSSNGFIGKNCTVPPPVIDCSPNQVVLKVDDSFVREYDMGIGNSRLILGPQSVDALRASPTCFPDSNNVAHTFSIPLPFSKCGILVDTSSGQTVVMGTIWLNRITQSDYDMPVPVVNFKCTYRKEYLVVTSLEPAIDQPVQRHGTGERNVQGTIELCKVPTACPRNCPALFGVSEGAIYTIGEMIHLNIRPEDTQFRDVVALRSLFLSCDGTAGTSAIAVPLVTGGCVAGSMPTSVSRSGLDSSVCVSFELPRLLRCTAFYIHAEMEICGPTGCFLDFKECVSRGSRGRRDAEDVQLVADVKGPIYSIDGSRGVGYSTIFPNTSVVDVPYVIDDLAEDSSSSISETVHWTPLILGVGASLLCIFVVLGVALLALAKFSFMGK